MRPTDVTTIRDVQITRLGLGSAPLGGLFQPVSDDVAYATVVRGYELGLRYFDTAPLYGYGKAERHFARALASFPRSSFSLTTKVGRLLRDTSIGDSKYDVDTTQFFEGSPFYKNTGTEIPVFDYSYDGAMRSFEESLARLNLDYVDIVHVHDPEDHIDEALTGACRALVDLRGQGVVGAVGIGTDYSEPAVRFVEETDVDCVLIAGRWTLLDQDALRELLPKALARKVKVIVAGAYNSGVLASPGDDATFDYAPCPPHIKDRALAMEQVCARFEVPLKAAALQFPYRHPAVASVVVGARSPAEIEENVRLAGIEIPDELWHALNEDCQVPLVEANDSLLS
jgi:D-threo-aldose 1-dehydrogenase